MALFDLSLVDWQGHFVQCSDFGRVYEHPLRRKFVSEPYEFRFVESTLLFSKCESSLVEACEERFQPFVMLLLSLS